MTEIIGDSVRDGVPYINGKPCTPAPEGHYSRGFMKEAFAPWLCPECGAAISTPLICLNLCGLSAASARRFNAMLGEAAHRVSQRESTTHEVAE